MPKKEPTLPLCEDCKKILDSKRSEVFVVCNSCFEARIDKWLEYEREINSGS